MLPDGLLVGIIVALVSGMLSALLTMIFMYVRGTRSRIDEQSRDLCDLQKNLPLDYVLRDDFIRWTIKIDKKLDDLGRHLEAKQ